MSTVLKITLIGLLAGVVGTGLGGVFATFIRSSSKRFLSFMLGFSAGIMLSVVFMELIPESISVGGLLYAFIGFVSGVVVTGAFDIVTPHFHFVSAECNAVSARFIKTGILTGIGIALHNLPEGLAIGASYVHASELGLSVALTIAIHNFPEGMAMAAPMVVGKMGSGKVVKYTAMAGLPMAIGAFIGSLIGNISAGVLSFCLSFAGGAMVFIVCDELIPDSQEFALRHSGTYGTVAGMIVGFAMTYLL